jgi:hypothetical protein
VNIPSDGRFVLPWRTIYLWPPRTVIFGGRYYRISKVLLRLLPDLVRLGYSAAFVDTTHQRRKEVAYRG